MSAFGGHADISQWLPDNRDLRVRALAAVDQLGRLPDLIRGSQRASKRATRISDSSASRATLLTVAFLLRTDSTAAPVCRCICEFSVSSQGRNLNEQPH